MFLFCARAALANDAGAFLQSGFGSRPIAMGNNFVAVADDVNALYWNAAGLSFLKSRELTCMYSRYFDEVTNVNAAYLYPAGKYGSFGVGIIRSSVDGIPSTDIFGNLTGYMSNVDQALCIAYSKSLSDRLALGLGFKTVSQSLGNNGNTGYDFDLSAMIRPSEKLSMGLTVQNALEGKVGPDKLDRRIKVGLAFDQVLDNLTLASDFDLVKSAAGYGLEWAVQPLLKIRAGVNGSRLFGGIGISYFGYTFDYSFNAHELGNVSTVAISVKD